MQTYNEMIAAAVSKLRETIAAADPTERSDIGVWAVYTSKHRDGFIQVGGETPFPQDCEIVRQVGVSRTSWDHLSTSELFQALHLACLRTPILPIDRDTPKLPDDWSVVTRGEIEFMVEPAFPGLDRRAFFRQGEGYNYVYYLELWRDGTRARSYGYGLASGGYPWAF